MKQRVKRPSSNSVDGPASMVVDGCLSYPSQSKLNFIAKATWEKNTKASVGKHAAPKNRRQLDDRQPIFRENKFIYLKMAKLFVT